MGGAFNLGEGVVFADGGDFGGGGAGDDEAAGD